MKQDYIETQRGDETLYHLVQRCEKPRRLVVLLPGIGYTTDRPLLYYAGRLALENQADVLNISYGDAEIDAAAVPVLLESIMDAISQVERPEHLQMILIGKSFGTLLAGRIRNRLPREARLILLTPIRATLPMMNGNHFLAISGSRDPLLPSDEILRWFDAQSDGYRILPGANHSLEIEGNTHESLKLLNEVLQDIEDFIKR